MLYISRCKPNSEQTPDVIIVITFYKKNLCGKMSQLEVLNKSLDQPILEALKLPELGELSLDEKPQVSNESLPHLKRSTGCSV